jgi:hypothetical protein
MVGKKRLVSSSRVVAMRSRRICDRAGFSYCGAEGIRESIEIEVPSADLSDGSCRCSV